jgi:hypothetical protein
MNTACAVLHIETDFLALLVITAQQRKLLAYVAVNEDSETFLTAPDFAAWADVGYLRRLRTRGLTVEQKAALRAAFIEQQVASLKANFQPFEIATNKSVTDKILFSLFGKGWGPGWKAIARDAEARISPADCPAFQYLLARHSAVDTARLGVLYLAHKHGLDQLSQNERESNWTDNFLDGAGAKSYYGGRNG